MSENGMGSKEIVVKLYYDITMCNNELDLLKVNSKIRQHIEGDDSIGEIETMILLSAIKMKSNEIALYNIMDTMDTLLLANDISVVMSDENFDIEEEAIKQSMTDELSVVKEGNIMSISDVYSRKNGGDDLEESSGEDDENAPVDSGDE